MKYMGSKAGLLSRGLGAQLLKSIDGTSRFVDLFCGAGSVSWYVAENCDVPVRAVDLQSYATTLAASIITRDATLDYQSLVTTWLATARALAEADVRWNKALSLRGIQRTKQGVEQARKACLVGDKGVVFGAYGGYYFSPWQALLLDAMLVSIPGAGPARTVCLAALLTAAAECVASPGHTAQPFRPTDRALPFIDQCWNQDPIERATRALKELCPRHAKRTGSVLVDDAAHACDSLQESDLVFVDPPYAAEQYSRFYHVLETIARGETVAVSGAGRYSDPALRPRSDFSLKSSASASMEALVDRIADRGARAVITFPVGRCSNGLSGSDLLNLAKLRFTVTSFVANGSFSTLGGNNLNRVSRKPSAELVLVLRPK